MLHSLQIGIKMLRSTVSRILDFNNFDSTSHQIRILL